MELADRIELQNGPGLNKTIYLDISIEVPISQFRYFIILKTRYETLFLRAHQANS